MIAPWINTCLLLTVLAWLWLIEARLRLAKAYRAKTLITEIDDMSRSQKITEAHLQSLRDRVEQTVESLARLEGEIVSKLTNPAG